jgi:16S rRNA (cytidine1402-2'-O)-methyltransferase
MTGKLYLLPNFLGGQRDWKEFFADSVARAMASLDGLIAESEKGGRSYLRCFTTKKPAHNIPIALLNEHSTVADYDFLLEPVLKGETWGLVSDAGLPCIADPGAGLVAHAKALPITVEAFSGPSSLTLALMLSGLPSQRFAFHGYLQREREAHLLQLEKRSAEETATQVFIEAPYRNQATLEAVCARLKPDTLLCVAWDLTLPSQSVVMQTVRQWRGNPLPDIQKKPAIFLVYRSLS